MTLRVAQFFLKIAHLSFSMGPRGSRAYGLRPRLWLLIQSISESQQFPFIRFCFFHLLSSPGPFTIGLTFSDRTNLQCIVHHFRRKNKTDNSPIQGPKGGGGGGRGGGSLEPWGPFLETSDNFLGPKTILGAQYSRIAIQFLLTLKAKFNLYNFVKHIAKFAPIITIG